MARSSVTSENTTEPGPAEPGPAEPDAQDGKARMERHAEAVRPARRRVSIDDPSIDLGEIPNIQILNEQGAINDDRVDPGLAPAELLNVHRAMTLTRKFDIRMMNMQRQGEMGTFAPGMGQEATQIGQVYPLRPTDWFSPSYRSFGAQIWRGWSMDRLMLLWDGFFEGFAIPEGVNDLPFSIVIGSHVPVATGVAMAIRGRKEDGVAVTNFGDGALSQGIIAESFNFAAVYKAPVIFVCENNGYAISMPVQKQASTDYLAGRSVGFGIPSMRVDGNDILAMIWAMNQAVERARSGGGPTMIEAVTYRMSVHTTADDPKVYRADNEVEYWKTRCPLARFETYLVNAGVATPAELEQVGESCEQEVLAARESFRAMAKADPHEIFEFIFADMPPELREQQAEYFEKLRRKGVAGSDSGVTDANH